MKKTMKRLAAITATMMTVSALSSISVFADPTISTEHYTNGGDSKSTSVSLQAKVVNTTSSTSAGAFSSNVDTEKHIWNVTIDTAELQWDIVRNNDRVYQQKLTWDPSNHSYVKENDESYVINDTYTLNAGETAAKSFNIRNDSNFAITSATNISPADSAYGATFNATNPENPIATGENANTTITIDITGMDSFDSEAYVTLGTANITLEATGPVATYQEPNDQSGE
jgi:hypothetical protein